MTKRLNNLTRSLLFGAVCSGVLSVAAAKTDEAQEWRFKVFLDDAEIGYHHFTLTGGGDDREMRTEASFKVKFLMIPVYRYRHSNTERWDGDCLEAIESETRATGGSYAVNGILEEPEFLISRTTDDTEGESRLPACVMTFAYWDPDFLDQPRLLNIQTGEYVDVRVELVGDDIFEVRDESVPAYRYRLKAEDLSIELWYSRNEEWLGLESAVGGGRRLRYELI